MLGLAVEETLTNIVIAPILKQRLGYDDAVALFVHGFEEAAGIFDAVLIKFLLRLGGDEALVKLCGLAHYILF